MSFKTSFEQRQKYWWTGCMGSKMAHLKDNTYLDICTNLLLLNTYNHSFMTTLFIFDLSQKSEKRYGNTFYDFSCIYILKEKNIMSRAVRNGGNSVFGISFYPVDHFLPGSPFVSIAFTLGSNLLGFAFRVLYLVISSISYTSKSVLLPYHYDFRPPKWHYPVWNTLCI